METMTGQATRQAAMGSTSDEELVRRVCAGETALFEVLMRRNNARVYRAVRALLRDEDEAEDVMQQAYVLAFTHLEQFKGSARFSTWLLRIAVNEALLHLRKRSRLVSLDGGADDVLEAGMKLVERNTPDPERQSAEREFVRLLEATIDALPASSRVVLMLREVDGLSTAETAEVLSVSQDVVKTRLHRARELLREEMENRLEDQLEEVFSFLAPRCDRVVAAVMSRLGMH
ncbi:RNA polymerase sigma factor [Archangium gephyra]|uniref:RNA polymerase sigma-54 factor RpoN n=3 Tax=Archangium gephyra TaxID=48 RepID=A0AAC8TFG6_9BACT|nr:RNA polymerase sigma-54 factor RpoN [Archangium gephyra]